MILQHSSLDLSFLKNSEAFMLKTKPWFDLQIIVTEYGLSNTRSSSPNIYPGPSKANLKVSIFLCLLAICIYELFAKVFFWFFSVAVF